MSAQRSYAFVLPRFGEGFAGGAEMLAGSLAGRLAARGDRVEILTTCARDNRSWDNELPAGTTHELGLRVTRFPVDPRNLEVWVPLQISICDGIEPSVESQLDWMANSVNSSGLYQALARSADEFDAIFFAPYLFGTTFWGSLIRPDKSLLIPCLHDEPYAYVEVTRSMFRQISGVIFNSGAEMELAQSLYGEVKGGEVGMGFEPPAQELLPTLTRYFADDFPYLIYVGRKETGKNVQLLVDHFCAGKDSGRLPGNLRLVVVGGGSFSDLHRPKALERPDMIDLSHVSELDKKRLIRHAALLCQPSTNESFSIVIMEAWLLGTPVLVHSGCAVTRQHATDSGGGLHFRSEGELVEAVNLICGEAGLRSDLAGAGERYVRERYSWEAVLQRFDQVMARFL